MTIVVMLLIMLMVMLLMMRWQEPARGQQHAHDRERRGREPAPSHPAGARETRRDFTGEDDRRKCSCSERQHEAGGQPHVAQHRGRRKRRIHGTARQQAVQHASRRGRGARDTRGASYHTGHVPARAEAQG